MAPLAQVPVLLLTGFPGRGKTSLLARWLKKPAFAAHVAPAGAKPPRTWLTHIARGEAADQFRYNDYVFNQMQAVHSFFPQLLIAFHKVVDGADMDNYLRRISGSARALDNEASYVETFDRGRGTALHLFEHVHGDSRERGAVAADRVVGRRRRRGLRRLR